MERFSLSNFIFIHSRAVWPPLENDQLSGEYYLSTYEKIMFFFQSSSPSVKDIKDSSHVSLGIARHDGTQFRRIQHEPVSLNEIILVGDNIACYLKNDIISDNDCWTTIVDNLIYDVLTSYID